MNKVFLIGRLTKTPELRQTQSGISAATFTIAINRSFLNAQGEREADFINCVCFKKIAENLTKYQEKGNRISVTGRLNTRTYEKDGINHYITEVIVDSVEFIDFKKDKKTEAEKEQLELIEEFLPF